MGDVIPITAESREGYERLLTPRETADMLHVHMSTLLRWARKGKLRSVRTLGNHRRFFEAEVREHLNGGPK